MHSILHKMMIETSPQKLIEAIKTSEGLSSWWTKTTLENNQLLLFFGSNDQTPVKMKILSSPNNASEIRWQCTEGPWQDKGEFVFTVSEHERGSCLHFAHHGWQETDDFFQHCNSKWGFFLVVSLKQYLENGQGLPHPLDPSI